MCSSTSSTERRPAPERELMSGERRAEAIMPAGRVGRPHGLDGSFYVTAARPRLLSLGTLVSVAGREVAIVRRAGTDRRPIVRLDGVEDRAAAEEVRGLELSGPAPQAPALSGGAW